MATVHSRASSAGARARRWSFVAFGVTLLSAASCDSLLEVNLPGRVPEELLGNPSLASMLVTSAVGDFECAYNNYVTGIAVLTDEFRHATGALPVRVWDLRAITPTFPDYAIGTCESGTYGVFRTLHTARFQAEDAIRRIGEFPDAEVPQRSSLLATAHAYAGYSYALLGESFCEVVVDAGPVMAPRDVFVKAEQHFTEAISLAQSANNADVLNLAHVGRARVRLNLGMGMEAAADARAVPDGYLNLATRSNDAVRRRNLIFVENNEDRDVTVDSPFRDVRWKDVLDPRVPVVNSGLGGQQRDVIVWMQEKYTSRSAGIPLAKWAEAQLIIAEVEGGESAVSIINTLHTRAGLPAFDPDLDIVAGPTGDNILNMVLEQRRRELFLEGHRLNDMLRYQIPFPSGTHADGPQHGEHGTTTCLPLPAVEQ